MDWLLGVFIPELLTKAQLRDREILILWLVENKNNKTSYGVIIPSDELEKLQDKKLAKSHDAILVRVLNRILKEFNVESEDEKNEKPQKNKENYRKRIIRNRQNLTDKLDLGIYPAYDLKQESWKWVTGSWIIVIAISALGFINTQPFYIGPLTDALNFIPTLWLAIVALFAGANELRHITDFGYFRRAIHSRNFHFF